MTAKKEVDVQKYVSGGAGRCPFCGTSNIDGEGADMCIRRKYVSGEIKFAAEQVVGCCECDAEWTDVYTLTNIKVHKEGICTT